MLMQNTLIAPPTIFPDLEVNPTFNVVIAYEDVETGKYAKETYDFLVENLGQDCAVASQMWKFDVLNIPTLHELAVNDALLADVIIISSKGGALPLQVQTWFGAWLSGPHSAIALVALFAGPQPQTAQVRTYLEDIAKRGRMEFFAHPDGWQGSADEPNLAAVRHGFPDYAGGIRNRRVKRNT
jgi:hypothetical protein